MDMITQTLSLDLVEISHNVINAFQGDRLTRDLDITITNNGCTYPIPSACVARLRGHRTDGKYIFYDAEITDGENGGIHVDIPSFLLSSGGRAKLDIGIYQKKAGGDTEIASTESFILYIPDNIFSEEEVVNSDNGSVLSKLINTAEEEIKEMNELEETVSGNEENRQKSEQKRINSENAREENEENRKKQETIRQQQETKRQEDTAIAIKNANDAAGLANQKSEDLQDKLDSHHFVLTEDKDVAGGVAGLGEDGKISSGELPVASDSPGAVKSGTDITVDEYGNVSVNDNSHQHKVINISDLTATASELNVLDGITASTEELNHTDGVTSNIQTQLDSKAPTESPAFTGTPNAPTPPADTNNMQIATTAFVKTLISNLINGAPETLDTLKEIADALEENEDTVQVLNEAIGNKVDKVEGKGLSTNDYTTEEKNKLSGIASGAEVNVQSDWNETDDGSDAYIKNKPTIPAVGNGTVTIKQSGTQKGTFTMNQSGNTTIELTDNNTTYSDMTGATASTDGIHGLVPAPAKGVQNKFLRGDGTWAEGPVGPKGDTGAKGDQGPQGIQGLKGDPGIKGDQGAAGTAAGFGTPTATVDNNTGTPSVTVTASGSNTSKVFAFAFKNLKGQKGDKGDRGINATTTSAATQSAAGLMSASDKAKLDGMASGANAYSLPLTSSTTRGGVKIGYTANGKNYPVQLSDEKMYVNVPWTDTWRGIQDNLTSTSGTESLSAKQGNLLANGSARDNTKLPLSGGTLTGTLYNTGGANDGRKTQMNANGFFCIMPDGGYAGGIQYYGSDGNRKGFMGYYKDNYYFVGENYNNANGKFKAGELMSGSISGLNTIYFSSSKSNLNSIRFSDNALVLHGYNGIVFESYIHSDICPTHNGVYYLGKSSYRWKEIWCSTSLNTSSDRNLKKNISDLSADDRYMKFFMLLQPKSYLFKDGESGRSHVGFISQDVEDAMTECGLSSLEFAGFCKDIKTEEDIPEADNPWGKREKQVLDEAGNPVYEYSLRYEEFIALNTMMIQKLYEKSEALEDRISTLENKILCV